MSIFDGARNRLKDTAKAALSTSREMLEISKLNSVIKTEEDKIKALKLELGNTVYKTYTGETPSEEDLNLKCEEIRDLEGNILIHREKVHRIKNQNLCPECNARIDRNYIFCPKCGFRLMLESEGPEAAVEE